MINVDRLRSRFDELASIGRNTETGGITRLSYSPEYLQGIELIKKYMGDAGLTVRVDAIGNVIGRLAGANPDLPVVMAGSHLDTVQNGGAFDGGLGVVAALECVKSWQEEGFVPSRSVEIVAAIEEEGNQFGLCLGTRAMAGLFNQDPANVINPQGVSLAEAMQRAGFDPGRINEATIKPSTMECFVELHVEQGQELELSGIPCGIVTDIVGIDRKWITIEGAPNHAGTTRMDRRHDALAATAQFYTKLFEKAKDANGRYVATIGMLEVQPGAVNIIPGKVTFSLEIRFITIADHAEADKYVRELFDEVAINHGVRITEVPISFTKPEAMDVKIRSEFRLAAEKLGIGYTELASWAGHDAQILAQITRTGMIFVPSLGGISHAPGEASNWDDIHKGVQVMNAALMSLAR